MYEFKNFSLLTDYDTDLFKSGKYFRAYEKFGSHILEVDGQKGVYFAVWAPNAREVSVIGHFNHWQPQAHKLASRWDGSGIWEGFITDIGKGDIYKYAILPHNRDVHIEKGDPFALLWEVPPRTASVVWETDFKWSDKKWMKNRKSIGNQYSVYEVHLGSWKKKAEAGNNSLSYAELAEQLVPYVKEMGFTHVELMPVMEHPFYGSWGYQVTGYFAPSSMFGTPEEFMHLIDEFHKAGIGVILDWVPSHFPEDAHGLARFDGTALYEHEDPRQGFHPDWKSAIFNYGRNEVRSFLISNALFWLDKFHADGLRVDAVASMLYLDYSRDEGQWIPNKYGGNENLEAISFLKELNESVYGEFPDAVTIAEESTAWPGVSKPTYDGGLGFGQKWMMGWMHDILNYFKLNPIHRKYHHGQLTFSMVYAFTENFMLPLSHDEVVHGKGPLIDRMPGDEWQRFANLRLLYGYMFTHPGTQILFMGGEFGQTKEWSHDRGIDWHLLEKETHQGIQHWVKTLNHYFRETPALHHKAFSHDGFEWIDLQDNENSVLVFLRKGDEDHKPQLVVCNFTPIGRENYSFGLPRGGVWVEKLNSDLKEFGGTGVTNGKVKSKKEKVHGRAHSLTVKLPPLSVLVFEPARWNVKPRMTKAKKKNK
ncbi:MAG: 1,4-alpha-glucan branching protein GlgB [Bacteroidota bacterium]